MKELAKNKKAGFDYEILEKFEAGLVLNGQEAKSIKTRGLSLAGSYVIVRPDGVFWIGAKIPPISPPTRAPTITNGAIGKFYCAGRKSAASSESPPKKA
jgi:tmRNA-binding protein